MSQTMLSQEERHRLMVEWNDTDTPYPRDATAHSLFEAQVEKTPEAIAVQFQQRRWTYRELNARANHLAHYLRRLNVGPDVLVGIYLERSLEMIAAIFGVLKAGGAYVPLDPLLPSARLDFLLQDARPRLVVAAGRLASLLQGRGLEVVSLDVVFDGAQVSETFSAHSLSSDNLAYVIYTSGSTGQPKGVEVPHAPLVNFVLWARSTFELSPADRVLQFAPVHFDTAGEEIFPCLAAGATLVLRTDQMVESPAAFLRRCAEARITVLDLPTAFWHELVPALERGDAELPEGLRLVVIGGESALSGRLAQWRRVIGRRVRLVNTYGPTETTVASTMADLTPEAQPREPFERSVPIGRPIANTRVYVLDSERQPVSVGVAGELYIGGEGVARGYLNRPDLTAERFISDPFGNPGSRLYKTGDLARYRVDGSLEFLGRLDDQVKIRGYRIELGEIESVLCGHPGVQTAVVTAREREPGVRSLVAYMVAHRARTLYIRELRAFLRDRLPEYMVPSAFVLLSAVPLTPSGKVDRLALPPPGFPLPEADEEYVAPRDVVELWLSKLWEKTLGLPRVGVKDNFFELGGNSIFASRLFAQIERAFGRGLEPTALLQAPTIESLAPLLRRQEERGAWSCLVPIQTGGGLPPLFCMHAGAGTVLFYYPLARRLGPAQPVYALQARGLYGREIPHARVEEMAAHYLEEMRSVQRRGPYYLAGFCFGAVLAFEIAQQLSRSGEEVGLLASFDGGSPGFDYDPPREQLPLPEPRTIPERFSYHWAHLRRFGLSYLKEVLSRRWIRVLRRYQYRLGRRYVNQRRPLPELLRRRYFLINHRLAEAVYQPQTYPGRMVIFETAHLFPDPRLGWEPLVAGGLDIHEIAGDHRLHRDLMSGEFIEAVSEKLRKYLNSAEDAQKAASRTA